MPDSRWNRSQVGGITILVALMLLVLLTVAAVGMSRNSFREVVVSGTGRQGSMTRNMADSGLEWSIFWLDTANGGAVGGSGAEASFVGLKNALLMDDSLSGLAYGLNASGGTWPLYDPKSPPSLEDGGLIFDTVTGVTQGTTLGLTRMGKLPITDQSQGVTQGAYSPAQGSEAKQAPDLWAVRSDAQVTTGPVTFIHSKEVWVSTPVQ